VSSFLRVMGDWERTEMRMGPLETSEQFSPTGGAAAWPDRAAVWPLIGRTPLVPLTRPGTHPGVPIHPKLAARNPGGSVKDRAAASILREALRSAELRHGRTILDATSGNTGIAYAMLGAALGYPVKLCVPSNVTVERQRLLRVYGAQIVWTDPM